MFRIFYNDLKKIFLFVFHLPKIIWFLCTEGEKVLVQTFREWKRRDYRVPPMTKEKACLLFWIFLGIAAIIGMYLIPDEIQRNLFLLPR